MLILTRRVGESIKIGDDITIIIRSISRNSVRIGIIAPKNIPIYRTEIIEKGRGNIKDFLNNSENNSQENKR